MHVLHPNHRHLPNCRLRPAPPPTGVMGRLARWTPRESSVPRLVTSREKWLHARFFILYERRLENDHENQNTCGNNTITFMLYVPKRSHRHFIVCLFSLVAQGEFIPRFWESRSSSNHKVGDRSPALTACPSVPERSTEPHVGPLGCFPAPHPLLLKA